MSAVAGAVLDAVLACALSLSLLCLNQHAVVRRLTFAALNESCE